MPLVVDNLTYLPERVNLLFNDVVAEHCEELGSGDAVVLVERCLILLCHAIFG